MFVTQVRKRCFRLSAPLRNHCLSYSPKLDLCPLIVPSRMNHDSGFKFLCDQIAAKFVVTANGRFRVSGQRCLYLNMRNRRIPAIAIGTVSASSRLRILLQSRKKNLLTPSQASSLSRVFDFLIHEAELPQLFLTWLSSLDVNDSSGTLLQNLTL